MAACQDPIRLQHMLNYASEVLELTRGRNREDLEADPSLGPAVGRLLEQIGAEAARVSPDYRASYAAIPWLQLIRLKEFGSRGYEAVDRDVLWKIVSRDLPGLVPELTSLILRLSAS